jgi:hypothetical protein
MNLPPLLAQVALLGDVPEEGLTRGETGTVVEHLSNGTEEAVLVEFADADGEMCSMPSLKPDQIIVLHGRRCAA